ncbi:MAG: hypothetical protein M1829_006000 [Trizodia sp. TS-e1964]|nr:MAG: hypothetical protein M1829_006000 [Trizodia sp. TS-e1964]
MYADDLHNNFSETPKVINGAAFIKALEKAFGSLKDDYSKGVALYNTEINHIFSGIALLLVMQMYYYDKGLKPEIVDLLRYIPQQLTIKDR